MKYKLLGALALLTTPTIAFAAPSTFQELAEFLVSLFDMASGLLILAGIVVYFFGISTNLFKAGEESSSNLKTQLMWGLIVLFVMVSIWGILKLLQETLFVSGNPASGGTTQQGSFTPPSFR